MYFLVNASSKQVDVATSNFSLRCICHMKDNILCNNDPKAKVKSKLEIVFMKHYAPSH